MSGLYGFSNAGAGKFYNLVKDNEFTGIYNTGHSIIRAKIGNDFAGYGRIFLSIPGDDITNITGNLTYANRSRLLFFYPVIIEQPAPELSGFYPLKGSQNTLMRITGDNLFSVNYIGFNNGLVEVGGSIVSQTNTTILAYPPSISSGDGYITVISPFGSSTIYTFTQLPALSISGYFPTVAHAGSTIRISGNGLASVTGLAFGSYNAMFSGAYENNTYFISGIVPTGDCCGTTVTIYVTNEGESAGY